MTNSDIIALAALGISGTISIITLVVGYLQNKANNRAKLAELAFEKRLAALQEICLAVTRHTQAFQSFCAIVGKNGWDGENAPNIDEMQKSVTEGIASSLREVSDAADKFREAYQRNRMFLPHFIDGLVLSYNNRVVTNLVEVTTLTEELDDDPNEARHLSPQLSTMIVVAIQKYIGFED